MAKAQQPKVIVGGGGESGGFSFTLNTVQAKNVQQVLGKTKTTSSKAEKKANDDHERSK